MLASPLRRRNNYRVVLSVSLIMRSMVVEVEGHVAAENADGAGLDASSAGD